jgi:predicted nucleic acid-binding protein
MAGLYLDTSSLGRVLLAEPDAVAIRELLGRYDAWWSSSLLTIELRRLARREGLERAADRIIGSMQLVPITEVAIERASRLDPTEVRALDAIHLDAAVELHRAGTIGSVITHDEQLARGCTHHGIPIDRPAS